MSALIEAARRALSLMDLTTLNDDDTDAKVIALCQKAKSQDGTVAAVCVYPRFVPIAKKTLREAGCPEVLVATSPTSRTAMTTSPSRWPKPAPPSPTAPTKWTWCSRTAR